MWQLSHECHWLSSQCARIQDIVIGGAAPDADEVINREEYFPYGETCFGSFSKKRYRFTGKERDEESGLYYFGARYYVPWIARWNCCDPMGAVDSVNLYVPFRSSPLVYRDITGNQSEGYGTPQGLSESTCGGKPLIRDPIAGYTGGESSSGLEPYASPSRRDLILDLVSKLPEPWRYVHQFRDVPGFEQLTVSDLQKIGAYPRNLSGVEYQIIGGIPFPNYPEPSNQDKALHRAFTGAIEVVDMWNNGLAAKDLAQLGSGLLSKSISAKSVSKRLEFDDSGLPRQIRNLEWDLGPAYLPGRGPAAGHHLQATLLNREGTKIAEWAEVSGNVGRPQGLSFPQSMYLVHTEVKALSRVRLQPGDTLLLFGERQVCSAGLCNQFLRSEAFTSGADILYFDVATGELLTAYLGRLNDVIDASGKLR